MHVTLDLDQESWRYRPGQRLSGKAIATVDKKCRCRGFKVGLEWFTHGRGNAQSKTIFEQTVFAGEWEAGERYTYPFEFTLPQGPMTYHGHYLNVDWRVKVQADLPWKRDPKADVEITLEPDPGAAFCLEDATDRAARPTLGMAKSSAGRSLGSVGQFIVVAFLLLFAAVGSFVTFNMVRHESGIIGPLVGGGVVLAALLIAGSVLRRRIAKLRVGNVTTEIEYGGPGDSPYRNQQQPADVLDCKLQMNSNKVGAVNQAAATLVLREKVTEGHGTDATTYTEELFSQRTPLISDPDEAGIFRGQILLPDERPSSFHTTDNELIWAVKFELDIPNWPDWVAERPLAAHYGLPE